MGESSTFIGLDMHKETITVALAEEGKRGEVRECAVTTGEPPIERSMVRTRNRRDGWARMQ